MPNTIPTVPVETSLRDKAWGAISYTGSGAAALLKNIGHYSGVVPGTKLLGKGLKSGAKSALGYAAGVNKVLPISPEEMNRLSTTYNKSYNLKAFVTQAQESANSLAKIKPLTSKLNSKKETCTDIEKLGSVGEDIRTNVLKNSDLNTQLEVIEEYLGNLNPEDLTGNAGLQGEYAALCDELNKSDKIHTPTQAVEAINILHDKAKKNLQQNKKNAIAKLNGIIPADKKYAESDTFKSFAALFELNPTAPETPKIVQEKINALIVKTDESYKAAEKKLDEEFSGIPAKKDGDKEIPAVRGVAEKMREQQDIAETDLIRRAIHLEDMEASGYKIPSTHTGPVLSGNDLALSKEDRAKCLQGKTRQDLMQTTWDGKIWGQSSKNSMKTRRGTPIDVSYDTNGKPDKLTLKVAPMWLEFFEEGWREKMELNLEDFISEIKATKGLEAGLSLTIDHSVDENRKEMVLATYRAALKNGYKPEDIKFTVTGSKEDKLNFTSKPANEVMKSLGLSTDHPDITTHLTTVSNKKSQETKLAQKNMSNTIQDLKTSGEKDISKQNISEDPDNSASGYTP